MPTLTKQIYKYVPDVPALITEKLRFKKKILSTFLVGLILTGLVALLCGSVFTLMGDFLGESRVMIMGSCSFIGDTMVLLGLVPVPGWLTAVAGLAGELSKVTTGISFLVWLGFVLFVFTGLDLLFVNSLLMLLTFSSLAL